MTRRARRRPLLCALNLKHDWLTRSTDDGGRYRVCRRCGREGNPTSTAPPGSRFGGPAG